MIGSTRMVTAWAHAEPVDMRKSFDDVAVLVTERLERDPLSGDLFLFVSRDRRRAKVLHWDGTGLCLFCKRLETGPFPAPWRLPQQEPVRLTVNELQLLLEGSALVGRVPPSPAAYPTPSAKPGARASGSSYC